MEVLTEMVEVCVCVCFAACANWSGSCLEQELLEPGDGGDDRAVQVSVSGRTRRQTFGGVV